MRSELGHRISPMLSCSHKEGSTKWSSLQLNGVYTFCICTGGDPVLNSLPVGKETADAKNFSRLRYFFFFFMHPCYPNPHQISMESLQCLFFPALACAIHLLWNAAPPLQVPSFHSWRKIYTCTRVPSNHGERISI